MGRLMGAVMKKAKRARIMPLLEFDLTNKNQVYTQDLD